MGGVIFVIQGIPKLVTERAERTLQAIGNGALERRTKRVGAGRIDSSVARIGDVAKADVDALDLADLDGNGRLVESDVAQPHIFDAAYGIAPSVEPKDGVRVVDHVVPFKIGDESAGLPALFD